MKRYWVRRPSAALVVSGVALLVALTGTNAYATATNFLLNTSNTSSSQTTLNGSAVAGKALQITNTNTGASATGLGLSVASGHPPFTVNSTTQVPKLNASLLQGIPAGGFVQGAGSVYANATDVALGTTIDEIVAPGFATVTLACLSTNPNESQPSADFSVTNDSSVNETFFDTLTGFEGTVDSSGHTLAVYAHTANPSVFDTFSVEGTPSTVPVVTVLTVGGVYNSSSNNCHFQVQAITAHE